MAAEQYDLIAFGAGLAGQTAATLMARQGYRVLLLETPMADDTQPLPCCPALEKLLASLEAKQLPRHENDSFQLISDEIRLELRGALALEQELEREFPGHHAAILALLTRLDDWGRRLNLLLSGAAPDSFWRPIRTLAFYRRQLRQGLPALRLRQPIERLLATLDERGPQQAVSQLLTGLCLTTPRRLSIAQAALGWHIAMRPQCIEVRQVARLLSDRFVAAGGHSLPLQQLAELKWQGKRLQSIRLQDGRHLQARQYLIGPRGESFERPPATAAALSSRQGEPQRWIVSGINSQRPPILAPQVVLSGEPPLRLSWGTQKSAAACTRIEIACPAEPHIASLEPLQRRLAALLPFTEFKLSTGQHQPLPAGDLKSKLWPGKAQPQPVAPNVLFCDGFDLLPSASDNVHLMLGQAAAGVLHKRLG